MNPMDDSDDDKYCLKCSRLNYSVCMCDRFKAVSKLIIKSVEIGVANYEAKRKKNKTVSGKKKIAKNNKDKKDKNDK